MSYLAFWLVSLEVKRERFAEWKERLENIGLACGWLFSSSLFVNHSVKVVSKKFDPTRDEREDERSVSKD